MRSHLPEHFMSDYTTPHLFITMLNQVSEAPPPAKPRTKQNKGQLRAPDEVKRHTRSKKSASPSFSVSSASSSTASMSPPPPAGSSRTAVANPEMLSTSLSSALPLENSGGGSRSSRNGGISCSGEEKASQRCHNCRARRLVCDQTLPSCQKCAARGVACPGYGRNLRWVQPQRKPAPVQAGEGIVGEGACDGGKRAKVKRARGRPRLLLMDKEEKAEDPPVKMEEIEGTAQGVALTRGWQDSIVVKQAYQLREPFFPVDYHETQFLLDHLHYHNEYMIKDLGVVTTTASVHNIPLQVWRHIPDYLVNVLIATGTTHQIIRSQPREAFLSSRVALRAVHQRSGPSNIYRRLQSFHHPSTHLVFEHFQKAISAVNGILAKHPDLSFQQIKGLNTGDLMIAAISGLMLSEIQQTAFGSWPAHFEALRVMLDKRGGFRKIAEENQPRSLYLLNIYMLVDVLRRPTTTSRTLTTIHDEQHVYLHRLDLLFQDGLETGSPTPSHCLESIIRTNQLRRRWHLESSPLSVATLREESVAALRFARQFDPIAWARARKPEYENMLLRRAKLIGFTFQVEDAIARGPVEEDWVDFAVVHQLAAVLYALRTTIVDRSVAGEWPSASAGGEEDDAAFAEALGLDPHETAGSLLSATLSSLLLVLRRVRDRARQGRDWPWRFVFWPVFAAGMESACSGQGLADRGWIVDDLYAMGQRQADFSLCDAADYFADLWEMDGWYGIGGRTWDGCLEGMIDGQALFLV